MVDARDLPAQKTRSSDDTLSYLSIELDLWFFSSESLFFSLRFFRSATRATGATPESRSIT
jgi:hypothetical protein